MYFLSPDATLSAAHRADILSSIFSPFMFCVVPTASRLVAVPRPGMSMLMIRHDSGLVAPVSKPARWLRGRQHGVRDSPLCLRTVPCCRLFRQAQQARALSEFLRD